MRILSSWHLKERWRDFGKRSLLHVNVKERVCQYLTSSVTQILSIMVGVLSFFALHVIHCKMLSYTGKSVYKLSGYLKIK